MSIFTVKTAKKTKGARGIDGDIYFFIFCGHFCGWSVGLLGLNDKYKHWRFFELCLKVIGQLNMVWFVKSGG